MRLSKGFGRNVLLRIGLIIIILCVEILGPQPISAHTSGNLLDITSPDTGLSREGVHQWIIDQAIRYLKDNNLLRQGTPFSTDEFANRLKWGAAYADHTGRPVSVGIPKVYEFSWDVDGTHHFTNPKPIEIIYQTQESENWIDWLGTIFFTPQDLTLRALSGNSINLQELVGNGTLKVLGDVADPGTLTAPDYAYQLYSRAVEFWPGGNKPIDLALLKDPMNLGFVGFDLDRMYYAGWGQGTDPSMVWHIPSPRQERVGIQPPSWPPWALGGLEDQKVAAVYLGWALHMVQDSSVWFHAQQIHGTPHELYESHVEDLVFREKADSLKALLPLSPDSLPCLTYINFQCTNPGQPSVGMPGTSAPMLSRSEKICLNVAPDYLPQSINEFNAETLAVEATRLVKIEPTFSFCDASGQYTVMSLSWSSYEHQVYSLDVAIKATAALIYKFIYDVSEEVYVHPSNNGVEDGSIAHPFNTLAEAVQELSERPTKRIIKLPEGVYSDKLIIDKPCILQPWSVEEQVCNRASVVDVDKLNIRPQPTTNSTSLGAVDQGAIVDVLCGNSVRADDIVWVRVRWASIEGWMSSRYLKITNQ